MWTEGLDIHIAVTHGRACWAAAPIGNQDVVTHRGRTGAETGRCASQAGGQTGGTGRGGHRVTIPSPGQGWNVLKGRRRDRPVGSVWRLATAAVTVALIRVICNHLLGTEMAVFCIQGRMVVRIRVGDALPCSANISPNLLLRSTEATLSQFIGSCGSMRPATRVRSLGLNVQCNHEEREEYTSHRASPAHRSCVSAHVVCEWERGMAPSE